jgi:release factor glutamine methyltransferase
VPDPFAAQGRPTAAAVREAARRLAAAGVPAAANDARLLLAHVLGRGPGGLAAAPPLGPAAVAAFEGAIERRAAREPLQHITGTAPFRHLQLAVGPGVFIPRPETEIVVEAALSALAEGAGTGPAMVADLGAGSGAIALALATERRGTTVLAVEIDPGAAAWLARNTAAHADALAQAGSRIAIVLGDAGAVSRDDQPLARFRARLPLVIANPPYIPDDAVPRDPEVALHDPPLALYGGPDGLDVVRRWLATAADLLAPGGVLVMEHADLQGGDEGVPGLLRRHEDVAARGPVWRSVQGFRDLAGRDRYVVAVRA